ncbi:hypothetical protein C8J57DRAFT_1670092 [Mycena rebaudengoi]|nr:hypothetical protein C8J57DRAFT_1670092 [Mycena rebaudengoi]
MKIALAFAALFFGPTVEARSSEVETSLLIKRETNFERMRRGLTPLAPTRRAAAGSRLDARASAVPCTLSNTVGYIQLTRDDGTSAGYISKVFDSQRSYTRSEELADALQVALPSLSTSTYAVNILAVNGPDPEHPYLGDCRRAILHIRSRAAWVRTIMQLTTFLTTPRSYAYLAGTGASPANSPPSSSAGTSLQSLGYNGPSESQIWTVDCATRQISAQWTNVDYTQPATTIFYDTAVDYLGITADLATFNHVFDGEDTYAVTFTFVPM